MSKQLYCGAARGVITPPDELIPHLRGLRDSTFGGVLDELYVRVIAVGNGRDKALLVAFDLDKAPNPAENIAHLSARSGIPPENIFFFSTHTHTAPVTGYRPDEPPNDVRLKPAQVQQATARYEQQVTTTLFAVVDQAIDNLRPARMGHATGESYINVNRSQDYVIRAENGELHTECFLGVNFAAPVDHTLFVLAFEDLAGQPIAFFINYPVHNCVMIGNACRAGKIGLTGDLSGRVCRFVEETYPCSTAIWSSGAAGDINPLIMNESFFPDPHTGRPVECLLQGGLLPVLDLLAARHFTDVMQVIRKIQCTAVSAPVAGVIDWSYTPGRNVVPRPAGSPDIITGDGVDPYEIRLHLLRLGELALLGFSGELYSSLGRRLQEISPLEHTLLINHDASLLARSGYIFDDETLARDWSNRLPGHRSSRMLPGTVLASLEKHMLEMFRKLGD